MIFTIGPGGCGFTFLNWSLTYLSGATEYKTLDRSTITVDANPLQGLTAHGFAKDHVRSPDEWHRLQAVTPQSIVYFTPTHQRDLDQLLNYSCKKIIFQAGNFAKEYFARTCFTNTKSKIYQQIEQWYDRYGVDTVRQILLDNVEILTNYYTVPDTFGDYQFLCYKDMFQNLDQHIEHIFDFLDLTIDQTRRHAWQLTYFQWKESNQGFLEKFLPKPVQVDKLSRSLMSKELVKWKIGLSGCTWNR